MKKNQKVLLTLTGLVITSIHVINKLETSACVSKNILKNNHSNSFLSNIFRNRNSESYTNIYTDPNPMEEFVWRFGNVKYRKNGNGQPILLIHDLIPGASSYEFREIETALAQDHTVYVLDLLGYGLSDKPNMTYSSYLFVQLITDFVRNVIGKKTAIISSGNTSVAAVMSVHNEPDLFSQLIMINPQDLFEGNKIPSKKTKFFKLLIDTPIIGTFIYNMFVNRTKLETEFKYEYFYQPTNNIDDYIDAYLEAAHLDQCKSKYAYSSFIAKYTNMNILSALKQIQQDTLIISGLNSSNTEMNEGNYQYFNRNIESVKITNSKHMPHIENAEETLKYMKEFLD